MSQKVTENPEEKTRRDSRERVETVVKTALTPHFPHGIPPLLARAVAEGEKDRDKLARHQGDAALDLVIFDTDRIGSFVFDTMRPPILAGGSRILKQLNDDIKKQYKDFAIFSGGGEGIFLMPAGKGAEACAAIETMFGERSKGALSVTTAWITARPADFSGAGVVQTDYEEVRQVAGTQALLARLRDRIREKKNKVGYQSAMPGDRERCVTCIDRKGSIPLAKFRPGETGSLCRPCDARWIQGKNEIKGMSFEELAESFPKAMKSGHLGLVYCDGNGMGDFFGKLDSLADLRYASGAVAHIFADLDKRVNEQAAVAELEVEQTLSLLGGGDEKIWILPANLAVLVCRQLNDWLAEAARARGDLTDMFKKQGLSGLTVGTGLVVADCKYPMRFQYELAKKLQASAKSRYYGGEKKKSFLDFAVIANASAVVADDLEAARRQAYGSEDPDFLLTCRPYEAKEFSKLLARIDNAGDAADSQLYQLRRAASEGPAVLANFARYQVARVSGLQDWLRKGNVDLVRRDEIDAFFMQKEPGGENRARTWLGDALELAPYATTRGG